MADVRTMFESLGCSRCNGNADIQLDFQLYIYTYTGFRNKLARSKHRQSPSATVHLASHPARRHAPRRGTDERGDSARRPASASSLPVRLAAILLTRTCSDWRRTTRARPTENFALYPWERPASGEDGVQIEHTGMHPTTGGTPLALARTPPPASRASRRKKARPFPSTI